MLLTYSLISIASGLLFGILDGLINANPLARHLFAVYEPIARKKLNLTAGIAIDLLYGFILAGLFLLLFQALPGDTGLLKGLFFGLLAWFLRGVMSVLSQWMMFTVPFKTLLYSLLASLGEMLILGLLYGLTLRPAA
jgi:hypothetical protein